MGSTDNGFAWVRRQIADDGRFDVDFSLHDFCLGSDNRGPSPIVWRPPSFSNSALQIAWRGSSDMIFSSALISMLR